MVTAGSTFDNEPVHAASCYEMTDVYNGGMPQQQFCEGFGVARSKFDLAGAQFGYVQELTSFQIGSAGAVK